MSTEKDFIKAIESVKADGKEHSLAEVIEKVLKGKIIEIYIGDTYEDIKYDDSTRKYPAVLIGKLIAAYGECLFLNCIYMDHVSKKIKAGNIVCLNERAIRTISEVDDNGSLKDTFLSPRDTKVIKGIFDDNT